MPITTASGRHIRLPARDVVAILTSLLGAPLVAVLGGTKTTRSVRQWIAGEFLPAHESRMRAALGIADILLTQEKPDVVRAWFAGNDPHLEDRNPIVLLAESDSQPTREAIYAAARKFVSEN